MLPGLGHARVDQVDDGRIAPVDVQPGVVGQVRSQGAADAFRGVAGVADPATGKDGRPFLDHLGSHPVGEQRRIDLDRRGRGVRPGRGRHGRRARPQGLDVRRHVVDPLVVQGHHHGPHRGTGDVAGPGPSHTVPELPHRGGDVPVGKVEEGGGVEGLDARSVGPVAGGADLVLLGSGSRVTEAGGIRVGGFQSADVGHDRLDVPFQRQGPGHGPHPQARGVRVVVPPHAGLEVVQLGRQVPIRGASKGRRLEVGPALALVAVARCAGPVHGFASGDPRRR